VIVAHFTDVHFLRRASLTEAIGKRTLGLTNLYLLGRKRHFDADAVVPRVLADALGQKPDLAVVTGDLSALSLDEEFVAARAAFDPLFRAVPTVVIPGNHDVYTEGAARERRFERAFGDLLGGGTWDGARWSGGGGTPWPAAYRHGEVSVIVGNPCRPSTRATGRFPDGEIDAIAALLRTERAAGRFTVLAIHYPLVGPDGAAYRKPGHSLDDLDALLAALDGSPPDLLLHGHRHQAYVGRSVLPSGREILTIGAGSSSACSAEPSHAAGWIALQIEGGRLISARRRVWLVDAASLCDDPVSLRGLAS
jgi:3',5'-cyclic AMP phosphodiesterase CpdA